MNRTTSFALLVCFAAAWSLLPAHATNRVLLIDQSTTLPAAVDYYTDALDALGIGYDVYEVATQGGLDLAPLDQYVDGAVVWCLPLWVLADTDVYAVEAYLDSGGNLFLSSADAFARCFL